MLVVTILLLLFLIVLNGANYILSRRESVSELDRILMRIEVPLPGYYFVARVNPEGTVVFRDLTHSAGLSADDRGRCPFFHCDRNTYCVVCPPRKTIFRGLKNR